MTIQSLYSWLRAGSAQLKPSPDSARVFDLQSYRARLTDRYVLSSPTTFVYQAWLPGGLSVGIGVLVVALLRADPSSISHAHLAAVLLLVVGSMAVLLALSFSLSLRLVWIIGSHLEVLGPRGREIVLLRSIKWVELTSSLDKARRVVLQLEPDVAGERRIRFIPVGAGLMMGGGEGVAAGLRQLVDEARHS
jgi:hypothetical protein